MVRFPVTEFGLQGVAGQASPEPVGQELSELMCLTTKEEVEEMRDKPYARILGKVMYTQVGT